MGKESKMIAMNESSPALRLRACLLPLCALLLMAMPANAAKVAIIDRLDEGIVESLLTAALSGESEIDLLERREIDRLAGEKQLGELAGAGKFTTLGGMLGADGLLVLERLDGIFSARLIGVRTGACLFAEAVPEKEGSDGKIAALLAAKTARLTPKLLVDRSDALPVSVLNIRATLFNPANARLESSLTRLLELRLAAMPNVILLERRRLGDAEFERSLDATDLPPLRNGAALVDGSLDAAGGDHVTVKLRVRSADGDPATIEASGQRSDPAGIAGDLATQVARELGASPPGQAWDRDAEAEKYFQEAAWAWRGGASAQALEAVESARALGDRSPELAALSAWLLAERASPKGRFYQGKYPSAWSPPDPAEQARLLEWALAELGTYAEGGGSLKRLKKVAPYELRHTDLERNLIEKAGEFLRKNDHAESKVDVAGLRRAAHDAVGMETEGKAIPDRLAAASRYVRDFASDSDELVALHERLLRSDHQWMGYILKAFPKTSQDALSPRFEDDAAAADAWKAMLARQEQDPATRLRVLLVLAGNAGTPEQKEIYRRFLRELGERGRELFEAGKLNGYLEGDPRGRAHHKNFQRERSELLLKLLNELPAHEIGLFQIVDRLDVPIDLRQTVWRAFAKYRARCLAAAENREKVESSLTHIGGTLRERNPGIATAKPMDALAVTRFWHPYARVAQRSRSFVFNRLFGSGTSVWICGFNGEKDCVYEIDARDLSMKVHPMPGADTGAQLAVTPEALWMRHGKYPGDDRPMEMFLVRRDRATGEMRTWPLAHGGNLEMLGERIFLTFDGGTPEEGLAEFDPRTCDLRTWVSTRRNPPETPLDSRGDMRVRGVVEGPGGRPHIVVLDGKASGVFAIGEGWERLAGDFRPSIVRSGRQSVLASTEKVIFLDPASEAPEIWLAGPLSTPEEQARARWPGEANFDTWRWELGDYFAFREGELFALEHDLEGAHHLRWWFDGAPPGGLHVPLRFDLPASARAEIAPYRKAFAGFVSWEGLLNPIHVSHQMQMASARDGLILTHKEHGFWFIPFTDLERWRKSREPND